MKKYTLYDLVLLSLCCCCFKGLIKIRTTHNGFMNAARNNFYKFHKRFLYFFFLIFVV